jgi:hypothetical protein
VLASAFADQCGDFIHAEPSARGQGQIPLLLFAASATAKPEPKTVFHSVKILVGGMLLMVIAGLLILQFLKGKQHAAHPARAPAGQVR